MVCIFKGVQLAMPGNAAHKQILDPYGFYFNIWPDCHLTGNESLVLCSINPAWDFLELCVRVCVCFSLTYLHRSWKGLTALWRGLFYLWKVIHSLAQIETHRGDLNTKRGKEKRRIQNKLSKDGHSYQAETNTVLDIFHLSNLKPLLKTGPN